MEKRLELTTKEMEAKHYKRLKGFLKYDIEERKIIEQKIILEQVIKVAEDMLKGLENK